MRDIAVQCGVNQSTVSRALRNDRRLGKETIERIVAAAEKMGYDPMRNMAARRLASMRYGQPVLNNTIGFFFFHKGFSQSAYFTKLQQGVLEGITEVDFEIYTSDQYKISKRHELPAAYRRGDVDGVLAAIQTHWWEETLGLLRAEPNFGRKPIVGLVEPIKDSSVVCADNYGAAVSVAEHLLELGHKRVMHFESEDRTSEETHSRRGAALWQVFEQRGFDPSPSLIHGPIIQGEPPARGPEIVEALKASPDITAVIAHDDEQAVEIYDRLTSAGYRVPQDISLISYDDTDVIKDERGDNRLTSVRLPLFEIGRQGTLLLVDRILGKEPEDKIIQLPTELIVRGSTGPAPSR
jgi:LacI family transcriptional regulator